MTVCKRPSSPGRLPAVVVDPIVVGSRHVTLGGRTTAPTTAGTVALGVWTGTKTPAAVAPVGIELGERTVTVTAILGRKSLETTYAY